MEYSISKYCHMYSDERYGIIYNCKNSKSFIFFIDKYYAVLNNDFSKIASDEFDMLLSNDFFVEKGSKETCDVPAFDKNKVRIRLFTTTACNAKCPYCYEKGIKTNSLNLNKQSQFIEFVKSIASEKILQIEWFGGEPLVNFDAIRNITNELNNRSIKFSSSIVTNGALLNKKIIDFLVNNSHLTTIQISIDAVGEKYNKIKGFNYDAFTQIIQNIEYIALKYPNIKILIRCNYSEDNINNVYELIEYFGSKEYKKHLYIGCFPIFNDLTKEDQIASKEKHYEKILFKLYENGLLNPKDILPRRAYYPCVAKSNYYYAILPSGDVYSCDRSYENKLGNIEDNINAPIVDCSFESKCIQCSFFPICFGGCDYERKLGKTGCEFTEKIIEAHLKLCLKIYEEHVKNETN